MKWARMCLMNIASSARFSSDRTVREYARDIWRVPYERLVLPPPMFDPVECDGEKFKPPHQPTLDKRFLAVRYVFDCV